MILSKFDDPEAEWAPEAPGRYCLRVCYCGRCPQYVPLPPLSDAPANLPRRGGRGRPRRASAAPPRGVRVALTEAEDAAALVRARRRQAYAEARGFRPRGFGSVTTHLRGCRGESAVARWAGVELDPDWTWEGDRRRGYDVAGYQVRTRGRAGDGLNLHRGDSGRFLLVLGHQAPVMWLFGTIDAAAAWPLAEARQSGVGDTAWWEVAQEHLDPLPEAAPAWDPAFAPERRPW